MTTTTKRPDGGELGPLFPLDAVLLDGLSADDRSGFIKYMAELDAENKSLGCPYGEGSLWQLTGAECWFDFYNDGIEPVAAIEEDQSYD